MKQYRIKTNIEIQDLYQKQHTVKPRTRWAGHVQRAFDDRL